MFALQIIIVVAAMLCAYGFQKIARQFYTQECDIEYEIIKKKEILQCGLIIRK